MRDKVENPFSRDERLTLEDLDFDNFYDMYVKPMAGGHINVFKDGVTGIFRVDTWTYVPKSHLVDTKKFEYFEDVMEFLRLNRGVK